MTDPVTHITEAISPSSSERPPTIWPSVPYPDPQAAIDFLVGTFGFEPTALIPNGESGGLRRDRAALAAWQRWHHYP